MEHGFKRRQVLKWIGAMSLAGFAGPGCVHIHRDRKLNVLVLGGTNFLGPAVVNSFIEKGHNVTLLTEASPILDYLPVCRY